MARNISPVADQRNDPGDSIIVAIASVRDGGVLGTPELRYIIQPREPGLWNRLLDADTEFNAQYTFTPGSTVLEGGVYGIYSGAADNWQFDLPDVGFLWPGDVMHYYIYAEDTAPGGTQFSTTPADISEFGDFSSPLKYSSSFTVRCLPSVRDVAGELFTPGVLFWNDFANRGGEQEWHTSLLNLGLRPGIDYDTYYTNGPSSGVGNGLGGRAGTIGTIRDYSEILYTAGDLGAYTITNDDYTADGGNDVGLLTEWLELGDKDMFMTGDDLVFDLNGSGSATQILQTDWIGVDLIDTDLRTNINNQATPLVKITASNPVFATVNEWIAYGGCLVFNTFDAVETRGLAQRLAQFCNTSGTPDYTYSAATLNINGTSRIISLPYDLMFVYTNPDEDKAAAGLSARARLLDDVLTYFGVTYDGANASPVPDAGMKFAARNYPNPFNPKTNIYLDLPKAGHLSLKIFNVRGELVRTLVDGQQAAGSNVHFQWDGTNDRGSSVSAGVYFYEARIGGEVRVNKMALVK
jgi:hypothetical protein